jgi:hypothetical protein
MVLEIRKLPLRDEMDALYVAIAVVSSVKEPLL